MQMLSSKRTSQKSRPEPQTTNEYLQRLPEALAEHQPGEVNPSIVAHEPRRAITPHAFGPAVRIERNGASNAIQPLEKPFPIGRVVPKSCQLDRKVALLKRSGLFGGNTRGARIMRAATVEDLSAAYRLVHDVYLGAEYIKHEAGSTRVRIFETSPDTATFIAKYQGTVVGVLSIIHDTPEAGLPSDSAFEEELKRMRDTGLKLGEVTNQAVAPEFRRSAVPTELMRCALAHGINEGFDLGIAAVCPSHNPFYELLGFEQVGGKRSYSEKLHDPVVPLMIDLRKHRKTPRNMNEVQRFMYNFLMAHNPYLAYVEAWGKPAREHFLNPATLSRLFVAERNFIKECTDEDLQVLHAHWGEDLFRQVDAQFLPPFSVDDAGRDAPRDAGDAPLDPHGGGADEIAEKLSLPRAETMLPILKANADMPVVPPSTDVHPFSSEPVVPNSRVARPKPPIRAPRPNAARPHRRESRAGRFAG
jgi:ribosomal protein S18 acetylase RimI-like enzyme